MKSFGIAVLAAALALFAATSALAGTPRVDARQARQDARIAHGVDNGSLTRCEATRLDDRAGRIHRTEARYRASGGVDSRERRILARRQNDLSADIHEQKHDGRGCW